MKDPDMCPIEINLSSTRLLLLSTLYCSQLRQTVFILEIKSCIFQVKLSKIPSKGTIFLLKRNIRCLLFNELKKLFL